MWQADEVALRAGEPKVQVEQRKQNPALQAHLDLPFNFPTDELEEAANTEILDFWISRLLHRFWASCAISDNDLISNLVP